MMSAYVKNTQGPFAEDVQAFVSSAQSDANQVRAVLAEREQAHRMLSMLDDDEEQSSMYGGGAASPLGAAPQTPGGAPEYLASSSYAEEDPDEADPDGGTPPPGSAMAGAPRGYDQYDVAGRAAELAQHVRCWLGGLP